MKKRKGRQRSYQVDEEMDLLIEALALVHEKPRGQVIANAVKAFVATLPNQSEIEQVRGILCSKLTS